MFPSWQLVIAALLYSCLTVECPILHILTVERPILHIVLLQFEKAENKPIVIGYIAAAAFALITAEWLIHLPALNVVSCKQTASAGCLAWCAP